MKKKNYQIEYDPENYEIFDTIAADGTRQIEIKKKKKPLPKTYQECIERLKERGEKYGRTSDLDRIIYQSRRGQLREPQDYVPEKYLVNVCAFEKLLTCAYAWFGDLIFFGARDFQKTGDLGIGILLPIDNPEKIDKFFKTFKNIISEIRG